MGSVNRLFILNFFLCPVGQHQEVTMKHEIGNKLMMIATLGKIMYYHSWRNNVVIAFETLLTFLTQLHIVSGVVCVVCPFAGDEQLKTFMSI